MVWDINRIDYYYVQDYKYDHDYAGIQFCIKLKFEFERFEFAAKELYCRLRSAPSSQKN